MRPDLEQDPDDPHLQQILTALLEAKLQFAPQVAAFWNQRKRKTPYEEEDNSQLLEVGASPFKHQVWEKDFLNLDLPEKIEKIIELASFLDVGLSHHSDHLA